MGTRYHYDRHGNYRGKTTDRPPGDGFAELIITLMGLFFLFSIFRGC